MTVTDFNAHAPEDRAGVWVDGNTHATELAGAQACLHLIELLLKGESTRVQQLLQRNTFYIVPRISADGAEHVLREGVGVRSTPLDFPGDLPSEDFQPQDLDGDGEALMMRVPDPAGAYKISPEDPRLMILREPEDFSSEQGPYYNLIPEGIFRDYDGFTRRYARRSRFDLNRQSPAQFSPQEAGAGPLPMYLPEARALAAAVVERPNINVCVTYHTYGGFLLRPSSLMADTKLPPHDLEIFKTMGKMGEKVTGYRAISVFHDFNYDPQSVTTGAWDDWQYHHRGIFAWTPEIWSLAKAAGIELERPLQSYQDWGADKLHKVLRWCEEYLPAGSFFKEWTPFEHPQLGRVEIGGWRTLYTWSNPPPQFLAAELDKLSEFVLRLAQMTAHVEIKAIDVQHFEGDTFAIRVALVNDGFLPTYISRSAQTLKVYKVPTARLSLGLGQLLVQGKSEQVLRHLEGRSQNLPWVSSVYESRFENLHEDLLQFTVQGRGELELEINYHGAGRIRQAIHLGRG
jgi:hypothetical protein